MKALQLFGIDSIIAVGDCSAMNNIKITAEIITCQELGDLPYLAGIITTENHAASTISYAALSNASSQMWVNKEKFLCIVVVNDISVVVSGNDTLHVRKTHHCYTHSVESNNHSLRTDEGYDPPRCHLAQFPTGTNG